MIAAVGNDGFREVVWGIGETDDEARSDAARWMWEPCPIETHEITDAQAHTITAGDVSWPVLA